MFDRTELLLRDFAGFWVKRERESQITRSFQIGFDHIGIGRADAQQDVFIRDRVIQA